MSGVILAFGKVTDEQCWAAVNGQQLAIRRLKRDNFLLDETNLVARYGTAAQRRQLERCNDSQALKMAKAAVRAFLVGLGDIKAVVMDEAAWTYWGDNDVAESVLRDQFPRARLWIVRKNGALELVS